MNNDPRTPIFGMLATPPAAFAIALIAALIGFGGTVALLVQMGQPLGGSPGQITPTVAALCLGIGMAGAGLSFGLRMPIVLAWSTPGAAFLATSASGSALLGIGAAFWGLLVGFVALGVRRGLGQRGSLWRR